MAFKILDAIFHLLIRVKYTLIKRINHKYLLVIKICCKFVFNNINDCFLLEICFRLFSE